MSQPIPPNPKDTKLPADRAVAGTDSMPPPPDLPDKTNLDDRSLS